jgi:tripartite-type tricarboxylate transporter receptor subunit TctC
VWQRSGFSNLSRLVFLPLLLSHLWIGWRLPVVDHFPDPGCSWSGSSTGHQEYQEYPYPALFDHGDMAQELSRFREQSMLDRRGMLLMTGAACLTQVAPLAAEGARETTALAAARLHFAGRSVRIIVPAAAGAGSDRSARQFLRALGRVLPETRLRVENIDRAGGQIGASDLWRAAPDGSVVGFPRGNLFYAALMERETLDFHFTGFSFFGSITRGHRVLVLGNESRFDGIESILAGDQIVLKTADAVNSNHYYEALLMNALTGSRVRPVPGFEGGSRNMAVISGEVDCQIGSIEAVAPIIEAGAGRIVFRLTSAPLPGDLPEVPRLADHLRDPGLAWAVAVIDAAAMLGRPFAGPPGMDPQIAIHWATLFDAVTADAAFRDEALAEEGLAIDPASAEDIAAIVSGIDAMGDSLRDDIDRLLACGERAASATGTRCD